MDEVNYHVEVDDDGSGSPQFLESFIPSLEAAVVLLEKWKKHYPAAYLTKCVMTRYWTPLSVA
ncbi:MAG: hypothetical protein AB7L09_15515 [Nitrospira sp.]